MKIKHTHIVFGINGTAKTYEQADYGIFKVAPSGRAILVGLADENFNKIEPPKN